MIAAAADSVQLYPFNRYGNNSILTVKTEIEHFYWPLRALPVVEVAGRFPLDESGFEYVYRHGTHALHLHDCHGMMRMGKRQYPLAPGVVTISASRESTSYDLPEAGHHWCIHFHPIPLRGTTMRLPHHFAVGPQQAFFADWIMRIARLHAGGQRGSPEAPLAAAAASASLQELLLHLAIQARRKVSAGRMGAADAAVECVLGLINGRFAEPLTVPELAAAAGMSQGYLAKQFRIRTGMPVPRYLLLRRIQHARQLISTTDLPISRIAARVGLPDPQHFNKQFRRLTGLSPSQARMERRPPRARASLVQ